MSSEDKMREMIIIRVQQYARRFRNLEISQNPEEEVTAARREINRKVEDWFLELISTEVAKAKITENQEEFRFNLHAEKSAGYKAGFADAVSQLVKYRDLRIEELQAEVESDG